MPRTGVRGRSGGRQITSRPSSQRQDREQSKQQNGYTDAYKLITTQFGTQKVTIDRGSLKGNELPLNVVMLAVAIAESGLDDDVYNGICCYGWFQVHIGNQSILDPNISQAEYVARLKTPRYNVFYAGKLYNRSGGGIGAVATHWEVYTNDSYAAFVPRAEKIHAAIEAGYDPDKLGIVEDITNIPGALGFAGDVLGYAVSVAAKKSAELVLGASLWVGRLVYREIMHPVWEHTQRATVYYWTDIMSSGRGENKGFYYDYAGLVTIAWWSLGYAVLWRDADTGRVANTPHDTPLGRSVRKAQTKVAQRKLYTPKEAKDQTPKKPKPKTSTAKVERVRSASVTRKRSVRVDFGTKSGATLGIESGTEERTPNGIGTE